MNYLNHLNYLLLNCENYMFSTLEQYFYLNYILYLLFDISFFYILQIFFVIHDPTTLNRQGNDAGTQYRSGIYVSTPEQGEIATNMLAGMTLAKVLGRPIVTEVLPLSNYWPAEDYHQDFFERNPFQGYCVAVAAPKVEKFRKTFARLVKA